MSEGGLKNPLKGISMKLLVFALYAQCRAGAGRAVFGQSIMAYRALFRESLRLFTVAETNTRIAR